MTNQPSRYIKFRHAYKNFWTWNPYQFAPDNTMVPVFSCGQFSRFETGHFTIKPNETVGTPIASAFRLAQYVFHLETNDKFDVEIPLDIQFFFSPADVKPEIQSRFANITDQALTRIVKLRAESILRPMIYDTAIRELATKAMVHRIQRQLCRLLNELVNVIGIKIEEHNIVLGAIKYPEEYTSQKQMFRYQDFLISSGLSQLERAMAFMGPHNMQNSDLLTMLFWMHTTNTSPLRPSVPPPTIFANGVQATGD